MRVERIGDATLYCGDALEILYDISDIRVHVSDPPYEFPTRSDGQHRHMWADVVNAAYWFAALLRAERSTLAEGGGVIWQFLNWRTLSSVYKASLDANLPITSCLVWEKQRLGTGGMRGLRPTHEEIALFCTGEAGRIPARNVADVWSILAPQKRPTGHPQEKPLPLIKKLVEVSPEGTVCDAFLGSGTTGVACVELGRPFVGVELRERWFDFSCRRIENAYRIAGRCGDE